MDMQLDVIVLTECWTNADSTPPTIDQYDMFYSQHSLNQNDGIVAYVRRGLNTMCHEPHMVEGNCLVLTINGTCSIVCSYRPPSFSNASPYLHSLDTILQNIKSKEIILTGDMNLDTINELKSNHTNDYLNIIAMHGLIEGINLPTRKNACLDHFMIKSSKPFQTVVLPELTDHKPIVLFIEETKISNQIQTNKTRQVRTGRSTPWL
ncbi:unnamed protein product [Colias eurytheme]|nr:unnamed protein product [Colias eurytheme]